MDFESYKFKYQLYLEGVMRNQSDIIRYTNECVCLESGDITGIQAINESAIDSVKAAIKKIISAIAGIWKKFAERVNELLTTDKAYLDKYKDIILNKPSKSRDISIHEYNEDKLKSILVPQFTYDNRMKEWLGSEDAENTFLSKFMGNQNLNNDLDIKEAVEEAIKGKDEVDKDGANLNIKGMYNFCANYKSVVDQIKKDTDIIDKAQSEINRILGQLAPKIKENDDTKKAAEQQASNTQSTQNVDTTVLNNSAVYSNVYQSYITELKTGKVKEDDTSNNNSNTNSSTNNGVGKDMNVNKNTTNSINSDLVNKDKEEFDKISKNVPIYFKCCGNILAGKLTVAQQMYKDYMTLIRIHVRDYVSDAN